MNVNLVCVHAGQRGGWQGRPARWFYMFEGKDAAGNVFACTLESAAPPAFVPGQQYLNSLSTTGQAVPAAAPATATAAASATG